MTKKKAATEPKQPHAKCGAKTRSGNPCQQTKLSPNGRCRMHGGTSPGAPKSNNNARTAGLFSKSLTPYGQAVYESTQDVAPEKLARDAANFAVAKVAEAYGGGAEVKGVVGLVEGFLDQLVEAERLSFEGKDFIMRRLTEPDIAMLGKALSPLKGLLEVKERKDDDRQAGALELLAKTIARSQERRDAGEE